MDETGSLKRVQTIYRSVALFWTNVCLSLVAINLIAAAALAVWTPGEGAPEPAYVDEALKRIYPDWSEEDRQILRKENRRGFEPEALVQFREKRANGRFFNLDRNGFRLGREQGPWPPDDQFYNVFVLGGSTAFGYGVSDQDTISSHLQDILAEGASDRPVRVYNFARGAFYSTMERLLFDKLVTLGPKPDLVVFIDGLNEFFWKDDPPRMTGAWTERVQGMLDRPFMTLLARLPIMQLVDAWNRRGVVGTFAVASESETATETRKQTKAKAKLARRAADRVIDRYLDNKEVIEALAAALGTRVVMVWQPVPTYKYDLRHHVFEGDFGGHELSRIGYKRMRRRVDNLQIGDNFIWCADIQQGVEELLYVDQVHYSPDMSRRVARCIADGLVQRGLMSSIDRNVGRLR